MEEAVDSTLNVDRMRREDIKWCEEMGKTGQATLRACRWHRGCLLSNMFADLTTTVTYLARESLCIAFPSFRVAKSRICRIVSLSLDTASVTLGEDAIQGLRSKITGLDASRIDCG
jgi:hypothetical protein